MGKHIKKTLKNIRAAAAGEIPKEGESATQDNNGFSHIFVRPAKHSSALQEIVFASENGSGVFRVSGGENARLVAEHCGDDGVYNPPEGVTDVNGLRLGSVAMEVGFGVYKDRVTDRFKYTAWVDMKRPRFICLGQIAYPAAAGFQWPNKIKTIE